MRIEILVMGAIAVLIAFSAGSAVIGYNRNPGAGQKIGQIVRVKKQGIIKSTWEAEIVRGGFSGGSGTMGAPFDFTIESDALASAAIGYMTNQTEVILNYRSELFYSKFRSDSAGNFAQSIAPIKK